MLTNGACILEINNLDFIVERSKDLWKRYCIISDDPTDECLFLVGGPPNPNYNPALTGYTVDGTFLMICSRDCIDLSTLKF
jgi:hypothetical protein